VVRSVPQNAIDLDPSVIAALFESTSVEDLNEVPGQLIREAEEGAGQRPRWRGFLIDGDMATAVVSLPPGTVNRDRNGLAAVPYVWETEFGAALSVTTSFGGEMGRAFGSPTDVPCARLLSAGPWRTLILAGNRAVASLLVTPRREPLLEYLRQTSFRARRYVAPLTDPDAAVIRALAGYLPPSIERRLGPEDHLTLGWAGRFRHSVNGADRILKEELSSLPIPSLPAKATPAALQLLDSLRDRPNLQTLVSRAAEVLAGCERPFEYLLAVGEVNEASIAAGLPEAWHGSALLAAIELLLLSSSRPTAARSCLGSTSRGS
jgi:hypothetical protein